MKFAGATARLEVDLVAGRSAATAACASSPMKLLVPRPRGGSVWAYLGSLGGGFVAGDQTRLQVRLGTDARCFLTTQASTKIYRNPNCRPCGHGLRADLATGSLLVLMPDPIQSFAGSIYSQRQEFYLEPGASLVLLDWFSSGRTARKERWNFLRMHSRNEVFVGRERTLLDSLLLDQSHGALDGPHRMGRFNCLAVIVIVGPIVAADASRCLAAVEAQPVLRRERLLLSASPIRDGAILRLAGERVEEVAGEIRRALAFIPQLLGDDPWSRKW